MLDPVPGDRVGQDSRAFPAGGGTRLSGLLALGVLLVVQALALAAQRTPIFEDDVLFFFRYADSLAAGHGYRFNAEELPVWGASAPLWPLLIALGEKTGLDSGTSCLAWSWLLTLASTLVLGLLIRRFFGVLGVLCLTPLLAFNHLHSTWATSGMESPLTFLLVALGLWAASGAGGAVFVGCVAGVCLAHKLDLAPFGLALLAGTWIWRRPIFVRAASLAAACAALWYGFAWWHFGSPLPNSFLNKLHASYASVGPTWFLRKAFVDGNGGLRSALALLGAVALRRQPFLALLALVQLLVPALGYTLRPPAESFMWYVAAVSSVLAFLASCGLAVLLRARAERMPGGLHAALALLSILGLGVYLRADETHYVQAWHRYLNKHQLLMKEAGQWVAENTPPDARVLTHWGNPAYYSHRFVYDATYLNRRPEEGDPILRYRPEVWVASTFGSPAVFRSMKPYQVVRTFETPERDFLVAVLFREDFLALERKRQELGAIVERMRRSAPEHADPELQRLLRTVRSRLDALPEAERRSLTREWPELEQLERWLPPKRRSGDRRQEPGTD